MKTQELIYHGEDSENDGGDLTMSERTKGD